MSKLGRIRLSGPNPWYTSLSVGIKWRLNCSLCTLHEIEAAVSVTKRLEMLWFKFSAILCALLNIFG